MKLLFVAGARPNFMKIAPLIRECNARSGRITCKLVHTGQHYDSTMSTVFFQELGIPEPDYHLEAGGGSHSEQTARIMERFDPVCLAERPDWVIVVGDVNSTMATAICAKKLGFSVAHVEAGLRSGDMGMPEEINRRVTDAITDLFFVTESSGRENLLKEGNEESSIHFVGHVMIDNLYYEIDRLNSDATVPAESAQTRSGDYGVVTLHRPANVDCRETLAEIVEGLIEVSKKIELVFPVHPRTRKQLDQFNLELGKNILICEPLGYREFLRLWKDSRIVLTDSGGLQEETTALGVPCLTLRDNTERPITVEIGTNVLVGRSSERIIEAARRVLSTPQITTQRPPLWDGKSSERILDILERVTN